MDLGQAPVLSTPAEHVFEETTVTVPPSGSSRLSEEQLYVQYEIKRTINEIRAGRWKKVALQFPDEMLIDAPRVFERLRDGLKAARTVRPTSPLDTNDTKDLQRLTTQLQTASIDSNPSNTDDVDESLCILADTSYGACCVDEVAAEHVDAEVVVHYGRACLSPTARLPVIYIFTSKPIDIDAAVSAFKSTYPSVDEKICLMADIPYAHNVPALKQRLDEAGFTHIFATDIVHNPSSLLPNRSVPPDVQDNPEALKEYSIFHISSPPTSLLLILSSRIKAMHVFPTDLASTSTDFPAPSLTTSTTQLLRRRYALLTRLSTVPVFGILINTLSVSNYLAALQHCQDRIREAGKKSYVFVVGKVNAAKIANFAEIGGWVVIGCWESSLLENPDFFRPVITPFELGVALTDDRHRVWGGEWIGDFSAVLGKATEVGGVDEDDGEVRDGVRGEAEDGEEMSDDEPPEFDLRTGRYVSHSRPMGRPGRGTVAAAASGQTHSSALIQRAKGDVATVGGQVSPAAEFLRSKRTWQGLGSDYEIAYERDENGRIRGAAMEEGRAGVAKGYTVGEESERT